MSPPVFSKRFGQTDFGIGGGVVLYPLPDAATYIIRDISGFVGANTGGPGDMLVVLGGNRIFYRACGIGTIVPFHQEMRAVFVGPGDIQVVCGGGAAFGAIAISGYELSTT